MRTINLIPAARLDARRRAARLRRCTAGCIVYAGLLVAACAGAHVTWTAGDATVPTQIETLAGENGQAEKTIAAVKADLGSTHSLLRASRAITEQPDWSTLLALLASKTGEDVVLKACIVRSRDVAPPPPPPRPAPGAKAAPPAPPAEPTMIVTVTGLGLTQLSVSQFVLRLEATGLFGNVRLIETTRETFERGDAVAFRAECSLELPTIRSPGAKNPTTAPAGQLRASTSADARTDRDHFSQSHAVRSTGFQPVTATGWKPVLRIAQGDLAQKKVAQKKVSGTFDFDGLVSHHSSLITHPVLPALRRTSP